MSRSTTFVKVSIALIGLIITSVVNAKPIQLNNSGNIERFLISPDNQYVVFNEFDVFGNLQRYTTKIDNESNPTRIGTNVNETLNGLPFWIHRNNSRVIGRFNNPITNDRDFLSVSIDGSNSVLLRPATPITGDVATMRTGESSTPIIAFNIGFGGGLYSMPSDGSSAAINLSDVIDPTSNIDVGRFRITQNDSMVVFDAELDAIDQHALFSVPIDGSANPLQLTPLNDSIVNNYQISEDQSFIIYVEETGSGATLQQQLFNVPIDGSSEPVPLTDLISGDLEDIDFKISPDDSHVVYSIVDELTNEVKLFSVSSNGNSSPQLIDEGIELHQFEITNNNEFIIYSITQSFPDNPFVSEPNIPVLLRSPLIPEGNNEPTLLSDPGFDIFIGIGTTETTPNRINPNVRFEVTSDSQFVYFIQDFTGDFVSVSLVPHLLRVTINNPISRIQINDNSIGTPLDIAPSSVENFILSNNEQTIIYQISNILITGGILDSGSQLARASANGDNNELLPTLTVGNVNQFEISNDDEFVIFTADSGPNNTENLYSIRLSDSEPLCFPIKDKNDNFVTICL